MKKTLKTQINIFLASTDEVEEERLIVKKTVDEINATWGRRQGKEINLTMWEDSVYPDFGKTPQDVIFEQRWDKIDIFIAIVWRRLGEGTEEEFLKAYDQYKGDPRSIIMMVYFKNVAGKLSDINPHELSRVNEFRNSIADRGGLYREFNSLEEFEQLLRVNLTMAIHDLPKRDHNQILGGERQSTDNGSDGDEPGLLDLVEDAELYGTAINSVVNHINKLTVELGSRIEERREEMRLLDKQDIGAFRNTIGNSAADLDWYSSEMETDIPKFRESFSRFIETYTHILEIQEVFETNAEGTIEARDQLVSMRDSIDGLIPTISDFRNTIKGLPPIARNLNRAKHRAGNVVDKLVDELRFAKDLIDQAVKGMTSR